MTTPFHLNGKTILVTGASSGIGRQIAVSSAQMGAELILSGRDRDRLQDTLNLLEGASRHTIIPCDLRSEEQCRLLAKEMPLLDGLVHAAGIVRPFPVPYLNEQKIAETLDVNLNAPIRLIASLFKARKINNGAAMVFLSSIAAQYPAKGNAMYAAAKAGLEAFAKTVAAEYAHKNIRANCLAPAMVKTPMYDQASEGDFAAIMKEHVARYPLGIGLPEDVANAAIFLLAPASRWITGTTIIMDGGYMVAQ